MLESSTRRKGRLGPARILSAAATLLLAACGAADLWRPPPPAPSQPEPTASPLPPSATAPPEEAPAPEITSYTLSLVLDPSRQHARVEQEVVFVNRHATPLAELPFIVEPNRFPDAFQLNDLRWTGEQPIEGYRLEGPLLTVPLPQPVDAGGSVSLALGFELRLPAQAGPFGYTGRQINLTDWYPVLPAYVPERGWLIHEPSTAGLGEHLAYATADYQVDVELVDPPPGTVVAASAPAESSGPSLQYRLESARTFALSVGSEYEVLTETVEGVPVEAYIFPEHRIAGQAALETSAEAIRLYSRLFGDYPHPGLTVVEAEFPDGRETSGLFFLDQTFFQIHPGHAADYLTALSAHETAHQWWFSLVGNDQALEPWLDEALATYSEALYYENVHPDLLEWWWQFRIGRYAPSGRVDSTIYDHAGFRPYVDAVYLRGASFLQAVRLETGDEAFLAFLRSYAELGAGRQLTADDFFDLISAQTEGDLEPLRREFFGSAP